MGRKEAEYREYRDKAESSGKAQSNGKAENGGKMGRTVTFAANWTIRIVGGLIFAALTWYAFRYTQYIQPGGREIPINVRDSMTNNLVIAGLALVVFVCLSELERRFRDRIQWIFMHVVLIISMLWVGMAGMWWISAVDRRPEGDQAFLYGGASYFLEGNFDFLSKGGYCSMYPHQLGLIALTELLFLVVGSMNYYAFQVICVMLAVGIVFLGYRIVREITDHTAVAVAYCLLMVGCLPLVFYTQWVYGDVPSIFFALLTADMLLQYSKKGKTGYLVAVVLSLTMALLVRKNSLILLIAFGLIAVVWAIRHKDRKIILSVVCAMALPWLLYMGIYKMYEMRSGYEHYKGIPTLSWVSMGMQEWQGAYGWYYDYAKPVYYANDCDWQASNEIYKQDIRDRMEVFRGDPSYALSFFREKVLSQWNEPLYQSLYFSNKYWDDSYKPAPDTLVSRISNEYFLRVLWICDRLQFVIYLGMVCYFLFAVKKDSNILQHLLAVAMIGGFFFSIIWEAKARYILPYYVTMFPCAAIGYEQLLRQAAGMLRRRGKQGQSQNGREIGRAA